MGCDSDPQRSLLPHELLLGTWELSQVAERTSGNTLNRMSEFRQTVGQLTMTFGALAPGSMFGGLTIRVEAEEDSLDREILGRYWPVTRDREETFGLLLFNPEDDRFDIEFRFLDNDRLVLRLLEEGTALQKWGDINFVYASSGTVDWTLTRD